MELVEDLCDRVAVIADGRVLATGTVAELSAGRGLHQTFLDLVGARDTAGEGLAWLAS